MLQSVILMSSRAFCFIALLIIAGTGCVKSDDAPCTSWYQDADGDAYGNPAIAVNSCEQPAGYVADNSDCNDTNRFVNPASIEISGDDVDNNCDGQSLLSIGDHYQGGIIFYIDHTGEHGLIASKIDQGSAIHWSSDSVMVANTRRGVGYGRQNTEYIVNKLGPGDYAAYYCANSTAGGYDDWYLPSLDELIMMCENLNLAGIGGVTNMWYWSSSHDWETADDVRVMYFKWDACLHIKQKPLEYANARAIRSF